MAKITLEEPLDEATLKGIIEEFDRNNYVSWTDSPGRAGKPSDYAKTFPNGVYSVQGSDGGEATRDTFLTVDNDKKTLQVDDIQNKFQVIKILDSKGIHYQKESGFGSAEFFDEVTGRTPK